MLCVNLNILIEIRLSFLSDTIFQLVNKRKSISLIADDEKDGSLLITFVMYAIYLLSDWESKNPNMEIFS